MEKQNYIIIAFSRILDYSRLSRLVESKPAGGRYSISELEEALKEEPAARILKKIAKLHNDSDDISKQSDYNRYANAFIERTNKYKKELLREFYQRLTEHNPFKPKRPDSAAS